MTPAERLLAQVRSADRAPIGSGMAAAAFRQGWKELGQAFGRMTPESVSVEELGSLGSPATPQIVTSQIRGRDIEPER